MRVIIAGGRTFKDYKRLCSVCDYMLQNQTDIEIVSGTAMGADKLGERYAQERGFKIARFPAEWDKHGKAAGFIRNEEMAKYSNALIAFWDGSSKGTEHMINLAEKHGLKIKICYFSKNN
jgi:hypothetical protein